MVAQGGGAGDGAGFVDYRYMIRWKAGLMWEMPELSSYEYVWMLDTDAFILGPIS